MSIKQGDYLKKLRTENHLSQEKLAEKLGVSELMPLFCELDEVMITLQHGVLHRKQALANAGYG